MVDYSRKQLFLRDSISALIVSAIVLVATTHYGSPIPAHLLKDPAIPYECAYLDGEIVRKVSPEDNVTNGLFYGLEVNVSVDADPDEDGFVDANNTTNYTAQFVVSELTYNTLDVGDNYTGYTCKMADIRQMIEDGVLTIFPINDSN
jgi:hypothetical protein